MSDSPAKACGRDLCSSHLKDQNDPELQGLLWRRQEAWFSSAPWSPQGQRPHVNTGGYGGGDRRESRAPGHSISPGQLERDLDNESGALVPPTLLPAPQLPQPSGSGTERSLGPFSWDCLGAQQRPQSWHCQLCPQLRSSLCTALPQVEGEGGAKLPEPSHRPAGAKEKPQSKSKPAQISPLHNPPPAPAPSQVIKCY